MPIRSRMISVIIGYNSLVEEYRCRRNKWVSRAGVKPRRVKCEFSTSKRKKKKRRRRGKRERSAAHKNNRGRVVRVNRIHKLWHSRTPMGARATDPADNPLDLSATWRTRDSTGRMVISTSTAVDALCERIELERRTYLGRRAR